MNIIKFIFTRLYELFWKLKIIPEQNKIQLSEIIIKLLRRNNNQELNSEGIYKYVNNLINSQFLDNSFSINYPKIEDRLLLKQEDPKLITFYLPQYCPNSYNDKWWGKGSTEWTNVGKSVPQYLGHYQPRCPGELGYYDLRIKENIERQVELAKIFGIYGFCFYYYWFDGIHLLEDVLIRYINDTTIEFPFSICWVNENWTQQWNSSSDTPIMQISKNEDSYKNFIKSCIYLFKCKNYIKVDDKVMLSIYKPDDIPNRAYVINYWREYVRNETGLELYLIGINPNTNKNDLKKEGFDAFSEFYPASGLHNMNLITSKKEFACKNFLGKIYDYKDFVENKKYLSSSNLNHYKAICPMWDNTARKKNRAVVLDGSTPNLYKSWLKDIINETKNEVDNKVLDDNLIFINAWNEWAEGAYLEPDLYWKYGYLEATRDAILECRCER